MSEEEKKAIENLKRNRGVNFKEADILSNLIDKQQKEIEELKKKKYIFNAETGEVKEIPISDNYISKDKIREKIKERNDYLKEEPMNIEAIETRAKISILKELLEEN